MGFSEINFTNKIVFIRVDYNVPIDDGKVIAGAKAFILIDIYKSGLRPSNYCKGSDLR